MLFRNDSSVCVENEDYPQINFILMIDVEEEYIAQKGEMKC